MSVVLGMLVGMNPELIEWRGKVLGTYLWKFRHIRFGAIFGGNHEPEDP
jgi:hypothetical protein